MKCRGWILVAADYTGHFLALFVKSHRLETYIVAVITAILVSRVHAIFVDSDIFQSNNNIICILQIVIN